MKHAVHQAGHDVDPQRTDHDRESRLPLLSRELEPDAENGSDQEIGARGGVVGRFDEAGEEGNDAHEENGLPRGAVVVDESAPERHA